MTRGVTGILLLPNSREAEISQFAVPGGVENNVFWTDIAMENAVVVDEFQGEDDASDYELSLLLVELQSFFVEMGT